MVLKILIALVAIVVALAAFVALQPSEYRIARSATIAAPRVRCLRPGERLP
jgi:hypothetical protein